MKPRVQKKQSVTAFAPASVGNVAVGFDILGFPVTQVGDHVTVEKIDPDLIPSGSTPILVANLSGLEGISKEIPTNPKLNTATVGLLKMLEDLGLDFGLKVSIKKGIPLSSGMGGSAASAVAAVVAANALFKKTHKSFKGFTQNQLLQYALLGEKIASGGIHLDNIAPSFYGGLTLALSVDPIEIVSIPVPRKILCVLVHPNMQLSTKHARSVLKPEISLKNHVKQSALLAGLISGCYKNSTTLIGMALSDVLIEPQRAHLIPGFINAKAAALQAGALGCSISGAGPSVFAWVDSKEKAKKVAKAISDEFTRVNLVSQSWISKIANKGARVVS